MGVSGSLPDLPDSTQEALAHVLSFPGSANAACFLEFHTLKTWNRDTIMMACHRAGARKILICASGTYRCPAGPGSAEFLSHLGRWDRNFSYPTFFDVGGIENSRRFLRI